MKFYELLVQNYFICLQVEVEIWQEVVKIGVDLLVVVDVVELCYYQVIFDGVVQYGFYFVIVLGLVMLYGWLEEGVKKIGFVLVMLKKLLIFNYEDNDLVDILIIMVVVDVIIYQEVGIMQIVNLFDDEVNFDCLCVCCSEQEVLDLIKNVIVVVV